ncbi:MAG: protein kinase [Vicinamibacterales bacterium]
MPSSSASAGAVSAASTSPPTLLGRQVAIKVVASPTPELRERFMREAPAIARLDHPNVVRIWDVGVVDDDLYIVQESAPSLAALVPDAPPAVVTLVARCLAKKPGDRTRPAPVGTAFASGCSGWPPFGRLPSREHIATEQSQARHVARVLHV